MGKVMSSNPTLLMQCNFLSRSLRPLPHHKLSNLKTGFGFFGQPKKKSPDHQKRKDARQIVAASYAAAKQRAALSHKLGYVCLIESHAVGTRMALGAKHAAVLASCEYRQSIN